MINMGYCRFENTNKALEECLDALNEERELSKSELRHCKLLFGNFIQFCIDEDIICDEDGELDDRLEEFFDTIDER